MIIDYGDLHNVDTNKINFLKGDCEDLNFMTEAMKMLTLFVMLQLMRTKDYLAYQINS